MKTLTEEDEKNGPIYGVPLMSELPLGRGCMLQALPNRRDLERINEFLDGQRVVAGYEVLLHHYRRQLGISNVLADDLARFTGRTVPEELKTAARIVDDEKDG